MTTMVEEKYATGIAAPKMITSDAQNEEYISVLAKLQRQQNLSVEEKNFARLLAVLIKTYEDERYPIEAATPAEVLRELIDANGLLQKDLIPVFGSKGAVSDAVSGKRPLSKNNIMNLSKRFNVSQAVFF